ncbi:MAG: hypothetical protein A2148_09240 [Chloroflexi bacterium RBG_16_68_14]|nr:MAG: hypothetical protein A2148_09240 [Chloroflexi bacterium RBG_16_68_14]
MEIRVCCFVDGSYLDRSLRAACGRADVDLISVARWLADSRPNLRTYYYTAEAKQGPSYSQYEDRERVRKLAETTDYIQVRLGRVRGKAPRMKEKGVDVYLVVDLLTLGYSNAFDAAVILGGDEDYLNAIDTIKRLGKHVEVAGFVSSTSRKMKEVADRFRPLNAGMFGTDIAWLP